MTAPEPRVSVVEQWRHVGRVAGAVAWLLVAVVWTGCEAGRLAQLVRRPPATLPNPNVPPPEHARGIDCLRLLPGGAICRREAQHRGPCDPNG